VSGRVAAVLVAFGAVATLVASDVPSSTASSPHPPILQRFLDIDEARPEQVRALRRLEAHNGHLDSAAWMEVWTEADASGFRYETIAEGGSGFVRSRVLKPALETEQRLWQRAHAGAITPENYLFEDLGADEDGLASIGLTPRRKDVLLVHGAIFLRPTDGDLVRIEGALSKTPSFWTKRVEIVRQYARIAGVRLPITLESVASVRLAGRSTFTMTYEYESVNHERVGHPVPTSLP
jgi:hypothetical protein